MGERFFEFFFTFTERADKKYEPDLEQQQEQGNKEVSFEIHRPDYNQITKSGSILSIKFKPVASNVLYDDCVRFTC